jgi:hypothetical protein
MMNTTDQKNGELQVWVNGSEALLKTDLRFRNDKTVKVDKFYFSTFYGGSNETWAPPKDNYIFFDDFIISTKRPAATNNKYRFTIYQDTNPQKSSKASLQIQQGVDYTKQGYDLLGNRVPLCGWRVVVKKVKN